MEKKKKLGVVITGIPQEWVGSVRVSELEEQGRPNYLEDGYYDIILENPGLAIELLKNECGFIL